MTTCRPASFLLACCDDWANVAGATLHHLRSYFDALHFDALPDTDLRPDIHGVALRHHTFNYSLSLPSDEWPPRTHYDILHIFHSQLGIIDVLKDHGISWHHLVVQHGGSEYRRNSARINTDVANRTDLARVLVETPDLLAHAAPFGPILEWWEPPTSLLDASSEPVRPPRPRAPVIAHFPSNPSVKNSALIRDAVDTVRSTSPHPFHFDSPIAFHEPMLVGPVSHPDLMERLSVADILVDAVRPTLNYTPSSSHLYGTPGVLAREAATLGCIVVAHDLWTSERIMHAKQTPYIVANTFDQLVTSLSGLLHIFHSDVSLWRAMRARHFEYGRTLASNSISRLVSIYDSILNESD